MSNDPVGSKKISQFDDMPSTSELYMGKLLGTYMATDDDSWHTGLVNLSDLGGDPSDYLEGLSVYEHLYSGDSFRFLVDVLHDGSSDPDYCWAKSNVISEYLRNLDGVEPCSCLLGFSRDTPGLEYCTLGNLMKYGLHTIYEFPVPEQRYDQYDDLYVLRHGDENSVGLINASNYFRSYLSQNAYEIYLAISEYLN